MQSTGKTGTQFFFIELATHPVLFDHLWHTQFHRFKGSKALLARQATATTANAIAFLVLPRVHHLGVRAFTEWAFHGVNSDM